MLLSQKVLLRHLDVVELNIRRRGSSRVRGLDQLDLDILSLGDQEDGKALLGLATSHEVVGEHAISDPLLRTTDDVMASVFAQLSSRAETSYIGSGESN